jgi:hypothetical protein
MAAERIALSNEERRLIVVAAESVFSKLRKMQSEIAPIYRRYGFDAPSAGVAARDLSEKIEASIVQHCESFAKGQGNCDLARHGCEWEVKICGKSTGLTINQNKNVHGENYIVVNYTPDTRVSKVWVLWEARDEFFSPRERNSNARHMRLRDALPNIEWLYQRQAHSAVATRPQSTFDFGVESTLPMLKAGLRKRRKQTA